eukprot:jgi/Hompol1/1798/HPOL_005724-RA
MTEYETNVNFYEFSASAAYIPDPAYLTQPRGHKEIVFIASAIYNSTTMMYEQPLLASGALWCGSDTFYSLTQAFLPASVEYISFSEDGAIAILSLASALGVYCLSCFIAGAFIYKISPLIYLIPVALVLEIVSLLSTIGYSDLKICMHASVSKGFKL